MRIELPSVQADGTHHWVEIRDKLMSMDRFEVQKVASVEVGDGRNRANFYEMANDLRNALLGRIITAWSFQAPIPSQNSFQAADMVLGGVLDLEDYAALEEAVEPFMDLIQGKRPQKKKETPEG